MKMHVVALPVVIVDHDIIHWLNLQLNAVTFMERCMCCSQMAARSVYRTLQSAEDASDAQRVLAIIMKIADDPGNVQYS